MGSSIINIRLWTAVLRTAVLRAGVCLATFVLAGLIPSIVAAPGRMPAVQARGVTMPFYAKGQPSAVAVLRVSRLFKDTRRVGFFKVRLLPILACEEVHLEILRPDSATGLLEQLESGLVRFSGGQPVEFRQLRVTVPGEPQPRLQARRARLSEEGEALVLEGVTFAHFELPRASLRLRADAGQVRARAGRHELEFHLFTGAVSTNSTMTKGGPQ
jgi:hypothetical protein